MKRTIVILSIVATLLAAGILYGGYAHTDYGKTVSLEEAYTAQFPAQMPNVVINPVQSFPVY